MSGSRLLWFGAAQGRGGVMLPRGGRAGEPAAGRVFPWRRAPGRARVRPVVTPSERARMSSPPPATVPPPRSSQRYLIPTVLVALLVIAFAWLAVRGTWASR